MLVFLPVIVYNSQCLNKVSLFLKTADYPNQFVDKSRFEVEAMKKAKKEGGKGENDDEEERGDSIESEEDFCNGKLLNDK